MVFNMINMYSSRGLQPEDYPLPDNFEFASAYEIEPSEIMSLRESVGWEPDATDTWKKAIETSPVFIGVRNPDSELVAMTRVSASADLRHGVICDMCVHPEFQGSGIGASMAINGLKQVEKKGIKYLYGDLSDENPLGPFTESIGFQRNGTSIFAELLERSE